MFAWAVAGPQQTCTVIIYSDLKKTKAMFSEQKVLPRPGCGFELLRNESPGSGSLHFDCADDDACA